jgi:hypothetical protein
MRSITVSFLLILAAEFITERRLTLADQFSITNAGMTQFNILKSIDNDDVCAVGTTPLMNFSTTAETCAFQCQHDAGLSSCGGFNYRSLNDVCELYSINQNTFNLQKNCRYFKVCFCRLY